MRVLVTGGRGYIGSNVCKLLAQNDIEHSSFDIRDGHDIRDAVQISSVFDSFRPDAVIHLAAISNVPACDADPDACHKTNIEGTANLLQQMREYHCHKLVFASSSAVYASAAKPLSEDMNVNPLGEYAKSKLAAEKMIGEAGISPVIFRIFNAAGADPELECGEIYEPITHLVPLAIRAARGGKKLEIFGDGSAVRDYIHVWDVAYAFLKGIYTDASGIFNIGSGSGARVIDVVHAVERYSGGRVNYSFTGKRRNDADTLIADTTLAKKQLGWYPILSSLGKIIEHSWRFEEKNSA